MKGFAKEQDEYIPEERRTLPCVTYRRVPPRGEAGWKEIDLPHSVQKIFGEDGWHTGGEELPVYAVLVHRDSGQVIDKVRRRSS